MIRKKVCMMGAYGVGKTSLVRRFVESIFDERYHTTIGVRIDKKIVDAGAAALSGPVMLMIWDMAGEDELEQVRLSHLRGAAGCIFVADGCRGFTLDRAVSLQQRVSREFGPLPSVLAVNKSDLREDWELEPAQISAAGFPDLFVSSAKTGESVQQMFEVLAAKMLTRM